MSNCSKRHCNVKESSGGSAHRTFLRGSGSFPRPSFLPPWLVRDFRSIHGPASSWYSSSDNWTSIIRTLSELVSISHAGRDIFPICTLFTIRWHKSHAAKLLTASTSRSSNFAKTFIQSFYRIGTMEGLDGFFSTCTLNQYKQCLKVNFVLRSCWRPLFRDRTILLSIWPDGSLVVK